MTNEQTDRAYEGKFVKKGGEKPPKKPHRVLRVFGIVLLALVVLAAAAAGTYYYMYSQGKKNMLSYDNVSVSFPQDEKQVVMPDDGNTLVYKGETYHLNTNLTTILFMGVDKKALEEDAVIGTAGQADAIVLAAMDTVTGETKLVSISREAYAQVDVYSIEGYFVNTTFEQLCLAYAYGDGKTTSCENTVNSVSRLLYGLPISSYVSLDLDGIIVANDSIGGVTVQSISDLTLSDGSWLHKGDRIHLMGKETERYIRSRDQEQLDSNLERMDRQKQYLIEFAKIVTSQAKKDLTVPVNLFNTLQPYMATNLTTSDVAFLSTCYLQHGARFDFQSIDGTIGKLNGSAVYYLDDEDLFETVVDVFYVKDE